MRQITSKGTLLAIALFGSCRFSMAQSTEVPVSVEPSVSASGSISLESPASVDGLTADASQVPAPDVSESSSPARSTAEKPTRQAEERTWQESGQWGWFVIGTGFALGAALAAHGLAKDCGDDYQCRVELSHLLWGGIGIASLGAMVGVIVLQSGQSASPEPGRSSAVSSEPVGAGLAISGSF